MGSLVTCIAKAGEAFSAEDRAELVLLAQQFRKGGMKSKEADLAAVNAYTERLAQRLAEAEGTFKAGRVRVEPVAQALLAADSAPAVQGATDQAAPAAARPAGMEDPRVATVAQQFPDLMVQLDGMDKPMPLAEFMASVKAEADELAADAPLMQLAAECALVNGL